MTIFRGGLVAAALVMAGCSDAPIFTITNRSTVPLSNLVVSGSGFSQRIDELAAGDESKFTVKPEGDSGVRIAFDAGEQHVAADEQGFVQPASGYRVAVIVGPDLKVSVSSALRP